MLEEGILATVFLFAAGVFVLVAGPVVGGLASALSGADNGAIAAQGLSGQFALVQTVTLVFVPIVVVLGVIFYAYMSTARREGYRGRYR